MRACGSTASTVPARRSPAGADARAHRRETGDQSGAREEPDEPGVPDAGAHDRGEAGAANSAAFIFRTSSAYEEVWMIFSNCVR